MEVKTWKRNKCKGKVDFVEEFEGFRQAVHELRVETANTVTNIQQRVVHLEGNYSGTYKNKDYLHQKNMIHKNFTDKADEWRSWQEEVADYVDRHTDPGNDGGTRRVRLGDGRH